MIIRNKFNGYGFDGTRLCHDPVSLSLAATQAGVASSAAATAAATTAATQAAAAAAAKAAAAEAAKTVALEGGKAATLEAGKTAALEASKKAAIETSMQQVGQQGLAQAGTEAAQQTGVEALKQGIAQGAPAISMPPAGNVPIAPAGNVPIAPAGNVPLTPAGNPPIQPGGLTESQQAYMRASTAEASNTVAPIEFLPPKGIANVPQTTSSYDLTSKAIPEVASQEIILPESASQMAGGKGLTLNNTGQGFSGTPQNLYKTAAEGVPKPPNALQKGFETGLQYVKDNQITSGIGLMSAGQYMNKPEEEKEEDYKSTVDMSEFKRAEPRQPAFTRSYEYQNYQAGGPVEDMSRMNSLGANTGFPMSGLQTPAYSISSATPMPTNSLTPTADASVNAYTGAAQFAEGGISSAQRREYGLKTGSERASRNLTAAYEEMEAERQKEAMRLFGERSDPGIIRRSRTQELSSPFAAAQAEHARLGKKSKVPVVELPKTALGDIDNYMDIPIEAAKGGIMHGLGGYSDGGRLLRGPGDGVSDSIPAVIGDKQPARLADGEFVVPARIVSELGNGSTEAGARKLYAMMERVQRARKKSIGKKKVAVNSKSDKHLPA